MGSLDPKTAAGDGDGAGALSPEEAQTLTGSAPGAAVDALLQQLAVPPSVPAAATGGLPAGTKAPIGREQEGRYRLLHELARGGQGVVWVAWDAYLGREVAFKQMLAARSGIGSEDSLTPAEARFVREARITAQLDHPGIAPVHEVGRRTDGTLYVTQKLVRGRTLAAALEACASLRERLELLQPFLGVCQAVAFAHGRGVIHRDLKPGNVMLGDLGEAVVLDWGLGRTSAEAAAPDDPTPPVDSLLDTEAGRTREGAVVGTPAYMSPEQALGGGAGADARADVWSLGVILYELLTGRRPFAGSTSRAVMIAVATGTVEPVRALCPQAPPELAAVAERALVRDPAQRYRSAKELAAELGAWLSGGRVASYDYSAWALVRRFVRRNPAPSLALALAFSLGLAASGLAVSSWAEARRLKDARALADAAVARLEAQVEGEADAARRALLVGELDGALARHAALARTLDASARGWREEPRFARDPTEVEARRVLAGFNAAYEALPPSFVVQVGEAAAGYERRYPAMAAARERHWPAVAREVAAQQLPVIMAYVPWVESLFQADVRSSVGAAGLWQLMPATARMFGLRVDEAVDERLDPERATQAGGRYLSRVTAEFGGDEMFLFALAAYNQGESKVRRRFEQLAGEPGAWRRERRDFFRLYRLRVIDGEPARFVAHVLGAAVADARVHAARDRLDAARPRP